jgi:hypothetical protein
VGCGVNLIAKEVFKEATKGEFVLEFFDLTLGSVILCIVIGLYSAIVGPIILKSPDRAEGEAGLERGGSPVGTSLVAVNKNMFSVKMLIMADGNFVGMKLEDTGIQRIKGIRSLRLCDPERMQHL